MFLTLSVDEIVSDLPKLHILVGIAVTGLCLLLWCGVGKSEQTPLPGCPPLPEQEKVRRVSIYVRKRLDTAELVCVGVLNGLRVDIEYGALTFWLQRWEEKEGKFLNVEERDLQGTTVPLVAYMLSAGGVLDRYLPHSGQPAPARKYRVRFRFRMPGQTEDKSVRLA